MWEVKTSLALHSSVGATLAFEEGTYRLKHQSEAPELQKGPSVAATAHSWVQPSIRPQG